MLQRIYGTAWESRRALAAHLEQLEQARLRDHRKLARELDLVSFPEELGAGLAVWHPHGAIVRKEMEDYARAQHLARGYQPVYSPHIGRALLWETSGHLDFYADGMYPPIEMEGETEYYPKPMNCPFHILVYRSRTRSYRELPLRLFELGTVYRNERSGVLHGLLRARGFTQDDSHIFCTDEQVVEEAASVVDFAIDLYRDFGFTEGPSRIALSTRPEKATTVGTDAGWAHAEEALHAALERTGLEYVVDEGEGAFYGPKIDLSVTDAIGRAWQLTTVQIDFNEPERFGLVYAGRDGGEHRPLMIHRALFGSLDRFFAILVEHYAGAFPTWLAPVQAVVVPVADRHHGYGATVARTLSERGFRALLDDSHDTMGAKIRRHQVAKVPYQLVVGDAEEQAGTVSVRARGGVQRKGVPLAAFADDLAAEVAVRGVGTTRG
jgi:threonyl-tRNA synthetase